MKRISRKKALLALGLSVLLIFAGCGSSDEETSDTTAETEDTEDAENAEESEETEAEVSDEDLITVNIGFSSSDGTNDTGGILGIAIHQGYLEEELAAVGATAEYYGLTGAGPAVNEAMASGSLDLAILGSTPATTAKSQGVDTTIVAATHNEVGGSIFTLADSGIESVEDLKGKTIAVTIGSSWQLSLDMELEMYGLTEDDVEIVNLALADLWEALYLGQVDAVANQMTNFRDNMEYIQNGEVSIVIDSRDYEELKPHGYYVTRTDFAEEHPEIVQAFVNALYRAYQYAEENPDALRDEATYDLDLYDYAYPDGEDPSIALNDTIYDYAQTVVDFMLETELITEDVDVSSWLDTSYYEEAEATYGE